MSALVIFLYALMLVFDAFIFSGTAYLIVKHGWSAWWILAAVIIAAGSNPRPIIETLIKNGVGT